MIERSSQIHLHFFESKSFKGCIQCRSTDHAKKGCPELESKNSGNKSNGDRSSNQKKKYEDRDDLELEVKRLKQTDAR